MIKPKFENGRLISKDFEISITDAQYLIRALELDASWDKTKVYYQLKEWINDEKV
jgi:hypothetical protein